jgi:hypothetical protein
MVEFSLESRIGLRSFVCLLEFENERHQRLGNITATENAEMAVLVGSGPE